MKVLTKRCLFCRNQTLLDLPDEGYRKWDEGEFVQDAFPDMPAEQRELLISGTCPACWNEQFSEEDS